MQCHGIPFFISSILSFDPVIQLLTGVMWLISIWSCPCCMCGNAMPSDNCRRRNIECWCSREDQAAKWLAFHAWNKTSKSPYHLSPTFSKYWIVDYQCLHTTIIQHSLSTLDNICITDTCGLLYVMGWSLCIGVFV